RPGHLRSHARSSGACLCCSKAGQGSRDAPGQSLSGRCQSMLDLLCPEKAQRPKQRSSPDPAGILLPSQLLLSALSACRASEHRGECTYPLPHRENVMARESPTEGADLGETQDYIALPEPAAAPAAAPTVPPPPRKSSGIQKTSVLGDFRLVARLGEGGM